MKQNNLFKFTKEYFNKYKEIIPNYENFLSYLELPMSQYFRINTLKIRNDKEKQDLLNALEKKGTFLKEIKEIPYFYKVKNTQEISIGNLEEYRLGLIHSMTLTSSLPVIALDPRQGELILDMCAAPGGKTGLIAMITEDKSIIVSNDKRIDRLTALVANIKRLGITCVITTRYRGEQFPFSIPFDKILVDAPCTGEGRYKIGEKGEILYQKSNRRTNLPSIQKGLLIRAFDILKPGGIIVYSTCTINPEENEEIVDYLLKKRQAEILDWDSPLVFHEGLTEWENKVYHPSLKLTKRYYPHEVEAVGFYVAKIKKV